MPVVFDSEKRVFKLDTPSSSYAMKISPTGYLLHLYYGAYVPDTDLDYLRMRQRNAAFSACVASAEEGEHTVAYQSVSLCPTLKVYESTAEPRGGAPADEKDE